MGKGGQSNAVEAARSDRGVEENDPFKEAMMSLENIVADFEKNAAEEEKKEEELIVDEECKVVENISLLKESVHSEEMEVIQEENDMLRTFTESFREETLHLRKDLDTALLSNRELQDEVVRLSIENKTLRQRTEFHQSKWNFFRFHLLTNLEGGGRSKGADGIDRFGESSLLRSQIEALDRAINHDEMLQEYIQKQGKHSYTHRYKEEEKKGDDDYQEEFDEACRSTLGGLSTSTRRKIQQAINNSTFGGKRSSGIGPSSFMPLKSSSMPLFFLYGPSPEIRSKSNESGGSDETDSLGTAATPPAEPEEPPLKEFGEINRQVYDSTTIFQDTMVKRAMPPRRGVLRFLSRNK